MDAAEVKQQIRNMPFCVKWVTTGAIVEVLLDKAAAGDPIDPQEMVQLMAEMVEFAEKHRDRIERENIPA